MPGLPYIPEIPKVTESYSTQKRFPFRPLVIIALILILIGLASYMVNNFQKTGNPLPPQITNLPEKEPDGPKITQSSEKPPAPGVIAKVGDELIYQRDLDLELAAYPPIGPLEERKKILLEKLATDSAVLQGAKADGLIARLDPTIYSSPTKDYLKRIKTIAEIKSLAEGEVNSIEGQVVSIWFYNFGIPAPIGYEEGKKLALDKITTLYNDVKSKKRTIEQAGELIRNDTSLERLDPNSYKQNAIRKFKVTGNEVISYNKDFDTAMRKLNNGEVSEIFLSQELGFDKPGYYEFGQVTEKITDGRYKNTADWIISLRRKYETILY